MNYATARPQIRSGHLLAWTHRSWGSWYDIQVQAVRTFTQSEYCHVGIAYELAGRLLVLEAVGSGVRLFPLSRELPFYWLPLEVKWESEVEAWAFDQLGRPYSKWQAILAGLGKLKAGADGIWQCAEYAQQILLRAGIDLPGRPTPANLVDQALKLTRLEKVEAD